MATTLIMDPYLGLTTSPQTLVGPDKGYGGRLVAFVGVGTYAGQAATATWTVCKIPASYIFLFGLASTDTTTGSTTVAIGVAGDTARYKAAAAMTTINTPILFYSVIAASIPIQADPPASMGSDTVVIATLAAATLPSSGTLQITMVCMAT